MFRHLRIFVGWFRRHPWYSCLILLVVGFVGLNVLAFQHARSMMWFVDGGTQTPRPEKLSILGKIEVLLTGVKVPRPQNDRTPNSLELEYTTENIPVTDDITLEAWVMPTSAPEGTVLLFHGYAGAKCDLLPEARAFHDLGYCVWLIDFRGSGGSSERYTTVGFMEAQDVAASVAYATKAAVAKPVILYGRSMGAAAILRAMHTSGINADGVVLESVFDKMLTTAGNRFSLMGLPRYPGANLLIFWGGVAGGFDASSHNPVEYASSCDCPTLLLHGEEDANAKLSEAKNVQSQLKDGSSELVIFPRVGHQPTLAASPERWRDAIRRLLKRMDPQ